MSAREAGKGSLGALAALGLALVSAAAMRAVFSPLQQDAQAQLHLSDLQVSLAQGLAASLPAAILSLPLGRLVDRANRARLMVVVSVVWTLGTFLTAFATGFVSLYLGRMLAGSGAICALPISISMAADLAPPERRGRAILSLSLGVTVGTALAFAAAGALSGALRPLAHGWPVWRAVHFVFGCASALLILPLLWLREPPRQEVAEGVRAPLGTALGELWNLRGLLIPLTMGQVAAVMADSAAGVWAAPLLARDYGLRPDQFGGWLGLLILVAGLLGALAGGFAADLGVKHRLPGSVLVGAVIASVLALPGAAFSIAPGIGGFAGLLALLLFCGAIMGLVTSAAIALLVPNEVRGLCLGALVVVTALLGLGLAPSLAPLVEAARGDGRLGPALAVVNIGIGILSCIGFGLAARVAHRHTRPLATEPAL